MTNPTFEQRLTDEVSKLARTQRPERDLWQGIEHAVSAQPYSEQSAGSHKSRWTGPIMGMAASVALLATIGLWLPANQSNQALIANLTEQHQLVRASLLTHFKEQPALTENWQQQLDQLDDATRAVREALEEQPDNQALLLMLKQLHQQQLDLIERVHAPKWSRI